VTQSDDAILNLKSLIYSSSENALLDSDPRLNCLSPLDGLRDQSPCARASRHTAHGFEFTEMKRCLAATTIALQSDGIGGDAVMPDRDPRCPKCGEDRLVE
jgi:hypothetical protein